LVMAISAPLAFIAGKLFGPITGLSIFLFGVAFGLMWEARESDGAPPFKYEPSPPIAWPVKFVGLAFIGAMWGGFASEVSGSLLGGAIALVSATAFVGSCCTIATKQPLKLPRLLFEVGSLFFGLGSIYSLSLLHA
jgi:hypothetical protein